MVDDGLEKAKALVAEVTEIFSKDPELLARWNEIQNKVKHDPYKRYVVFYNGVDHVFFSEHGHSIAVCEYLRTIGEYLDADGKPDMKAIMAGEKELAEKGCLTKTRLSNCYVLDRWRDKIQLPID